MKYYNDGVKSHHGSVWLFDPMFSKQVEYCTVDFTKNSQSFFLRTCLTEELVKIIVLYWG